jgi:hypothetical protein
MSAYLENEKDVLDAINKIKKLRAQHVNPDRNGMISALQDAKATAPFEITALELNQGDGNWRSFQDFSNFDLYNKLEQYQQGLANYCIEKVGKELFNKMLSGELEV